MTRIYIGEEAYSTPIIIAMDSNLTDSCNTCLNVYPDLDVAKKDMQTIFDEWEADKDGEYYLYEAHLVGKVQCGDFKAVPRFEAKTAQN